MDNTDQNDKRIDGTSSDSWAWLDKVIFPWGNGAEDCSVPEDMQQFWDDLLKMDTEQVFIDSSERQTTNFGDETNHMLDQGVSVNTSGHRIGWTIVEQVIKEDIFSSSSIVYWMPTANEPQIPGTSRGSLLQGPIQNSNKSSLAAQQCAKVKKVSTANPQQQELSTRRDDVILHSGSLQSQMLDISTAAGDVTMSSDSGVADTLSSRPSVARLQVERQATDEHQNEAEANGSNGRRIQSARQAQRGRPRQMAETVHKCRHCGSEFRQRCLLNRHIKVHEGNEQQLHRCRVCNAPFRLKTTLMKHVNQAHRSPP